MPDPTPEEAAARLLEIERDLATCLLHAEHMEIALATRDVIGQAKGIIMEKTAKTPMPPSRISSRCHSD